MPICAPCFSNPPSALNSADITLPLSLAGSHRDHAAQIARDWYVFLRDKIWEVFDEKFCSTSTTTIAPPGSVKSYGLTVGDFLIAGAQRE